jgi:hypothetical protein
MPEDNQPEVYDLNTHDMSLKIGQWCDAAFERHGQGERFVFQLTVQVMPPTAPNQPPSFMPAVIFWLPGAMLNTVMSGAFTINNPIAVTRDEVEETVRAACEQMLNARTKDLKQVDNGHPDGGPPLRLAP